MPIESAAGFFDSLTALDLSIFHAINGSFQNGLVDHAVNFLALNTTVCGTVVMAPYWYAWFKGGAGAAGLRRRRLVGAGLIGGLLSIIVSRFLAECLPFRERPMFSAWSGYVPRGTSDFGSLEHWSAFPSDTAAYSTALAVGLYRINPRLSLLLLAYAVAAGGMARVAFGIHYPSDVAVGALIGACAAWLADNRISDRLVDQALRWEAARPASFYLAAILATTEMARMFDTIRSVGRGLVGQLRGAPGAAWALAALVFAAGLVALAACLAVRRWNAGASAPSGDESARDALDDWPESV